MIDALWNDLRFSVRLLAKSQEGSPLRGCRT